MKRLRDFRDDGDDEKEDQDPDRAVALAAARRGKRHCVEGEGSSQRAVSITPLIKWIKLDEVTPEHRYEGKRYCAPFRSLPQGRTKGDRLRSGFFPTPKEQPAARPTGAHLSAGQPVSQAGPSRGAAGAVPRFSPSPSSRQEIDSQVFDPEEFQALRDFWTHKERRRQLRYLSSNSRVSGNTKVGGPRCALQDAMRQQERERARGSALPHLQQLQRRPGFLRRIVQTGQRAVRSRLDTMWNRVSAYLHARFEAILTDQRLYEERQQEELRRQQDEQQRQQEELRRQHEEERQRQEAEEQERLEAQRRQVRMEEHQRQDYQWYHQVWLREQGHTNLPAVAPPPATPRPQTNMNPQGVDGCYHNPFWSVSESTSSGGSNERDEFSLWSSREAQRDCTRRLNNLMGREQGRGQSSSAAYVRLHDTQPSQQNQRQPQQDQQPQRRRRRTRPRTPQGQNGCYRLPDDLGDSSSEEEDSVLPSPPSSSFAAYNPVSNPVPPASAMPSASSQNVGASSATDLQQSFDPRIPQGTGGRVFAPDFPENWTEIESEMANSDENSDSKSTSNESFFGTHNRQQ